MNGNPGDDWNQEFLYSRLSLTNKNYSTPGVIPENERYGKDKLAFDPFDMWELYGRKEKWLMILDLICFLPVLIPTAIVCLTVLFFKHIYLIVIGYFKNRFGKE